MKTIATANTEESESDLSSNKSSDQQTQSLHHHQQQQQHRRRIGLNYCGFYQWQRGTPDELI